MTQYEHDTFWFNDLSVLFRKDRLAEFYPVETMNLTEKLNSIVRFSLYAGILLYFYNSNYYTMYLPLLGLLLTKLLYDHHNKNNKIIKKNEKQIKEHLENRNENNIETNNSRFISDEELDLILSDEKDREVEIDNKKCVQPTKNNPFMNPRYTDYKDNVNRPEACDNDNKEIQRKVNEKYFDNLYRDVNDVFNRRNNTRQFYTMPSTTFPNDQDKYSKWLYGNMPSCKNPETSWKCLRTEDLRQNRTPVTYDVNSFQYDVNKDQERIKNQLDNMNDNDDNDKEEYDPTKYSMHYSSGN